MKANPASTSTSAKASDVWRIRRASAAKGLEIYFVDTEGGAATLIVSPAGESTLIDCGNPGERDADRRAGEQQLGGRGTAAAPAAYLAVASS